MKNKIKFMIIAILLSFLANVNTVLAENSQTTDIATLNQKIITMAHTLTGIIIAISTLMIVYGGFKYVVSVGDNRETEQAKNIIVHAGVGMFIAMTGFIILQIFATGTSSKTVNHSSYQITQTQIHKKELEKQKEITVSQNTNQASVRKSNEVGITMRIIALLGFISITVMLTRKNKEKEKETTNIINLTKEEQPKKIEKEQSLIANGINLLKSNLEEKEIEKDIKEKISIIQQSIETVEKEINRLDIETKYLVEESIKVDIENIVYNYQELDEEDKISYKEKVMNCLDKINEKLTLVKENIENQKKHEIEKSLMVVDEKYS